MSSRLIRVEGPAIHTRDAERPDALRFVVQGIDANLQTGDVHMNDLLGVTESEERRRRPLRWGVCLVREPQCDDGNEAKQHEEQRNGPICVVM